MDALLGIHFLYCFQKQWPAGQMLWVQPSLRHSLSGDFDKLPISGLLVFTSTSDTSQEPSSCKFCFYPRLILALLFLCHPFFCSLLFFPKAVRQCPGLPTSPSCRLFSFQQPGKCYSKENSAETGVLWTVMSRSPKLGSGQTSLCQTLPSMLPTGSPQQ